MILFTSSWDDGSVHDIKLNELLLKYSQKATFFIPLANNRRELISHTQIREISRNFEIGAHTASHVTLTRISDQEAEYEISSSRKGIEEIIGKTVHGFCFPRGKFKPVHVQMAKKAGFSYARTANMFKCSAGSYLMNTTLQAFDHPRDVYFYHLLKRRFYHELSFNLLAILKSRNWLELLTAIIQKKMKYDSAEKLTVIHLWGHSFELHENNSWNQLEKAFEMINALEISSMTNYEISRLNDVDAPPALVL